MYFYKDTVTDLYYIGNDILPSGIYILRTYHDFTYVSIETSGSEVMLFPTKVVDLQREDSSNYTDIVDLLNDVQDFFKNSTGTSDLTDVEQRLTILENTVLRITYYAEITETTGTIQTPTGATIVFDNWSYGIDALVSEIVGGKPNFESGGVVVTSFDALGAYVLSGATTTSPAAFIYTFDISFLDYGNIDKSFIIDEKNTTSVSGGSVSVYINLVKLNNNEGDLHFTDLLNWNTTKSVIKDIKVITASTDWDLYLLQNGNGFAVNDAIVPAKTLMIGGNLTEAISMDYTYEDEDDSLTLHLYWVDNSGNNTADFYISGFEME